MKKVAILVFSALIIGYIFGFNIACIKKPRAISDTFYVVSNPNIQGLYKIGVHTGDEGKLMSRYRTYFAANPNIHLFVKINNAKIFENIMKGKLKNYKHSGEWFNIDLDYLLNAVDNELTKYLES